MLAKSNKRSARSAPRKVDIWGPLPQELGPETWPVIGLYISRLVSRRQKPNRKERQWWVARGLWGALASLLNPVNISTRMLAVVERDNILHGYRQLGWGGVLLHLLDLKSRPLADKKVQAALLEAVSFWHMGWKIDRCDYDQSHGFSIPHWYVRRGRGRRPGACPIRREAAKKARWRKSPRQLLERRKRRNSGRKRPRKSVHAYT